MRVVCGPACGSGHDGEGMYPVVLGGGEGGVAVAARRLSNRGLGQDFLVETERESHRRTEVVVGERVRLEVFFKPFPSSIFRSRTLLAEETENF